MCSVTCVLKPTQWSPRILSHPMNRSKAALLRFTEMVLPQLIPLVLRFRETFRHTHDVDEEERHLMDEEPLTPQPPYYLSLLSLLEGGGSSTVGSDGVPPAQELGSSLSPTHGHSWLNPADVRIIGKHPVAAGGFADILEGVLEGRKIIVKTYRQYVISDHAQAISVCCRCYAYKASC